LKATSSTPPTDTLRTSAYQSDTTPTTSSTDRPDESFLSQDELTTLSASQLAFLVRKRKHRLGLGPLFSVDSQCSSCAGTGMIPCHQCNGTGRNGERKQEEMFDSPTETIRITNGHVNVSYYFVPNGPCWLCTSSKVIACSECAGSGIKGLAGFQGD